jgi:membrane protein
MNKDKIHRWGDETEVKSFLLVKRAANRLIDAFFHFKKRKGELLAGSATFFALLSTGPILLMAISLAGYFFSDLNSAKDFVLGMVNNNFPKLAPWILKSIGDIVNMQLKNEGGLNLLNSIFFLYACLGVVTSIIFGLNTVAKKEAKGGFFVEDMRSMGIGIFVAGFIAIFMLLSHKPFLTNALITNFEWWNSIATTVIKYNVLPMGSALGFFTFFYKIAIPKNIKLKDAFSGASAFVACFLVGKSFYWVYHLYSKDALSQSYGAFYTIVLAVFWVYFLMCSFFYGASVACVRDKDVYGVHSGLAKEQPLAASQPPARPSIPETPSASDYKKSA